MFRDYDLDGHMDGWDTGVQQSKVSYVTIVPSYGDGLAVRLLTPYTSNTPRFSCWPNFTRLFFHLFLSPPMGNGDEGWGTWSCELRLE